MTRGVQECIPFDLVVLMWQMYDRCKEEMNPCLLLELLSIGLSNEQVVETVSERFGLSKEELEKWL